MVDAEPNAPVPLVVRLVKLAAAPRGRPLNCEILRGGVAGRIDKKRINAVGPVDVKCVRVVCEGLKRTVHVGRVRGIRRPESYRAFRIQVSPYSQRPVKVAVAAHRKVGERSRLAGCDRARVERVEGADGAREASACVDRAAAK